MTYRTAIIKRNLELVVMFPFVILGKLTGKIFPLKTKHDIFLFLPSVDLGGSIKVNADITECIKDRKPLIILSKKPKNAGFRHLFEMEGVRIIDLHKYIDNKWYHFVNFFFRGVLAAWINKVEKPVVFGGEGLFFYKILPHIKKEAKTIELCHLNTWFNFSQAFVKYINFRVFSTPKIKRDVEEQYRRDGVPAIYFSRLFFIDNKIDIPAFQQLNNDVLQVLYVGRGAPQKRVHLVAEIARVLHQREQPVHFTFVGDVDQVVPDEIKAYTTLLGNVRDTAKLDAIYNRSDVLILTSLYEGLPIVIMDMMARGKVVLSTAVDGIPDYIRHKENGLLIYETKEDKIVEEGVHLIGLLLQKPELKKEIGQKSHQFAVSRFSGETFCKFYRNLLVGD